MSKELAVGQKMRRIAWRKGVPYVEIGTVTKVTPRTWYVDGEKQPIFSLWARGWRGAVRKEYEDLFKEHQKRIRVAFNNDISWTVEDTVRAVCELRRLERRLEKSLSMKE